MSILSRDEIAQLAGVRSDETIEEKAFDAAIDAHTKGTRYAFVESRLAITPRKGEAVPPNLASLVAENREAVRLAGALIIVAEMAGVEVASLSRMPVRYQFLGAYGCAAQALADGHGPIQ